MYIIHKAMELGCTVFGHKLVGLGAETSQSNGQVHFVAQRGLDLRKFQSDVLILVLSRRDLALRGSRLCDWVCAANLRVKAFNCV